MVDMGKDIANELKVKFVPVEVGGFGEAVLSLQAGKVDMNFALQATPLRRPRIDFAADLLDRMGDGGTTELQPVRWADYNKPGQGRRHDRHVDELLLRKMAPKARA
jgi:hypothetical protein